MPQIQLPVFPEGVTLITNELAFLKEANKVTYFNGSMPIFSHGVDDIKSFRMITSQFCATGTTKLMDISRAFGVPPGSVKRALKLYRQAGIAGFFKPKKTRGKSVLTDEVITEVQDLLNKFCSLKEISDRLNIKFDTLRKAVSSGRLVQVKKSLP